MLIKVDMKWVDKFARDIAEANKSLAKWGKEMAAVMIRANQHMYGGQQMKEQRKSITQKVYKERLAEMTLRMEEVCLDYADEAKTALDELLEELGIEVEKPPIWDCDWKTEQVDGDLYRMLVSDDDDWREIAEIETKNQDLLRYIAGLSKLVKTVIDHVADPHGCQSTFLHLALQDMNIEVKS